MSLICPRCNGKIPTFQVRAAFACLKCNGKLQSNHGLVLAVSLPLGVLGEVALFLTLRAALGSTIVAVYAWLIIGGLVGLLLYWLLVHAFCRLTPAT